MGGILQRGLKQYTGGWTKNFLVLAQSWKLMTFSSTSCGLSFQPTFIPLIIQGSKFFFQFVKLIVSFIIHIWVFFTIPITFLSSLLNKWHLCFHSFFCWLVNIHNWIKLQLDVTNFYLVLLWLTVLLYYYVNFQFSNIEIIYLKWTLNQEKNIALAKCLDLADLLE